MKKNCKKYIKRIGRILRLVTIKGDKLYVKWKEGCNSSFNTWIDKKTI